MFLQPEVIRDYLTAQSLLSPGGWLGVFSPTDPGSSATRRPVSLRASEPWPGPLISFTFFPESRLSGVRPLQPAL